MLTSKKNPIAMKKRIPAAITERIKDLEIGGMRDGCRYSFKEKGKEERIRGDLKELLRIN